MLDNFDTSAAWRVPDLIADRSWVFRIPDPARTQLAEAVKQVFDPARHQLEYSKNDFDLKTGLLIPLGKIVRTSNFSSSTTCFIRLP